MRPVTGSGIANLIVAYNGGEASQSALDFALGLAARHDAHLTGLLAHGSSRISRSMPNWLSDDLRKQIMSLMESRGESVRANFEERVGGALSPDQLHWLEVGGNPDTTVADYSRMYDFTILGQYENLPEADELVLHPAHIAHGSGKPVIVVPKVNRARGQFGGHAIVAWDGMRAVTGAVAGALPLLRQASRITVITIENARVGTPLEGIDVKTMLARHGLDCEWRRLPQGDASVVQTLLAHCAEPDVDLLVMGANAHSRIDRAIVGSATEAILDRTEVPILVSQ